ncbi:MAG: transposase [Thermacetogenium sp.]|jgi:transposase|nr:transposase [Thermacetogenium sp.]
MNYNTKFVGLDVSKESIAVAVADWGRKPARYWGQIKNTFEEVRKLMERIGEPENLQVCYEAGPTGYELYRFLKNLGIHCVVVAPSLIPTRSGDRVKTDRRDAVNLAQLLRAGELTPVWVPAEEDEALRDLVRAREDAKEDLLRAKHRLSKFLLRHNLHPPKGVRNWSSKYRLWLDSLKFENSASRITFQEYLHAIDEIESRIKRLETETSVQAVASVHAPVIQALQTLRGVAEVTATTLVAEIGQFSRFDNPRQLMAFAGLTPSEYSSGGSRHRGGITKTGNAHVRRVVIEASWSYRYPPALKAALRRRQEGKDPEVQLIAWNAQDRLHRKYMRLLFKGKPTPVVATAVARELLGFIWAIACKVEENNMRITA